MPDADANLRQQLLDLLDGSSARLGFAEVVAEIPLTLRGVRPAGLPHSLWEQLEHYRLAQWDLLETARDPHHASPADEAGYWPGEPEPEDDEAWERSLAACHRDLTAMKVLVADPETDLHAPIPWTGFKTVLRQALVMADHNAYHLGQMVTLRRLLGIWTR